MITPAADGYGGYLRCFNLAKQLVKRGNDVFLACPGNSRFVIRRDSREGVQVLTNFSTVGLTKFLPGTLASTCSISIAEMISRVHVVHVFSVISPISILPAILAKLATASHLRDHNLVVDLEDLWGQGGILRDFNYFVRSAGSIVEEGIPKLGDAVTAVSKTLLQKALRLGMNPQFAMKLPNGADVESIRPMPRNFSRERVQLPKEKAIVCVLGFAQLNPLLKEITALNMEQRILFVVVGNLPRFGKTARDIRKYGNVFFTGRQPSSLVPYYLGAADVLLLAQEPDPSSEARWPIRFGDYLAAGRPIVTPRIGEVSEVVESFKCGLLTRPGDSKDLADKLVTLAFDRELCEILGRNARRVAEEELSWQQLASRLETFYLKLRDACN